MWHTTTIRLVLVRFPSGKQYGCLVEIAQIDDAIAEDLKRVMTRESELPVGRAEQETGLCKLVAQIFYIVSYQWRRFLEEAESHLKLLVGVDLASRVTVD